jgi:hypothetical protein
MSYTVAAYYRKGEPTVFGDDDGADRFIDEFLEAGFGNSIAELVVRERPRNGAGYPDHLLRVAVDAEDKVGGLHYQGPTAGGFSKGELSKHEDVFYYYVNNDHTFPRDSVISLDLIRRAVKEFRASGGERPTCVEWQPERL